MRLLAFALVVGCASTAPPRAPAAAFALPFIDDDYPRALATARREHRPLFVDVWAPWCHTCLSLRAYVLRDPSLAAVSTKFVWAAIDSEKELNAPFLAKFPISSWPTLLVIDENENLVLRWEGAATASELTKLLGDVAAGKTPTILEAELAKLAQVDKPACAALARSKLPSLPRGTSRANAALAGLSCARGTPDEQFFVDAITTIVVDPADPILADDRSALYEVLIEQARTRGDTKGAKTLARAWATFLEGEAARARDPAARFVFDAHRMTAYLELGEPARAIPMLEESERDFPNDYNPPARLAKVHFVMGQHALARAAIERALSRAYGPRRIRLLSLSADIARAQGDLKAERAALDAALSLGKSPSVPKSYGKLLEQLETRRASLGD